MSDLGYIHLYTGDGKGKTTAAVGVTIRALGNGLKTLFVQFMKSMPSGEIEIFHGCGREMITVMREWDGGFVVDGAGEKEAAMCKDLWKKSLKCLDTKKFDLFVLDEIAVALYYGLLEEEEILRFLKEKPKHLEVILTGRHASDRLVAACDLVTEMRKVKHYFDAGIEARRGIEY